MIASLSSPISQRKRQRKFSLKPHDLLRTAETLIDGAGKPLDANLRRAISSVYYAMFHVLAEDAANLLVGRIKAGRNNSAWRQTYRALQHRRLKDSCDGNSRYKRTFAKFPASIRGFANTIVSMQEQRHLADYDPFYNKITKSSVKTAIASAKTAITSYKRASLYDRRSFCVFILFDLRA